ncbi:MAG: helix-turn-helix domain-containing protein [Egibacteraceae bacterium]
MNDDMGVGKRIRYWRKRRGISQAVLAERAGRSESWLEKVERGERVCSQAGDIVRIANVLRVEPKDLLPEFKLPPNGAASLTPPRGVPAIRHALFTVRLPDREPPDSASLRAAVEQALLLEGNGSYNGLALILPDLLLTSRVAVEHDVAGSWWCLAGAYQAAAGLAHTLRELDLQLTCADRAVSAAQQSGDPLMTAVGHRWIANALMRQGLLDDAGAVCSDAADAIAPTPETSRAGWSVWGALRLVAADAVNRSGDTAAAWRLLRDARAAAERVGSGRNDYWQAFGPASVGANEAGVALEAGDPVEALRIAERVEVEEMPTKWRRARFFLDSAAAQALRHKDDAAVRLLLTAETHAPEVVRYRFEVHELVNVLLKRERKSVTPGLRDLAERLGITV